MSGQHRSIAGTSLNLGKALCSAGRPDAALPVLARALEIVNAAERPSPAQQAQLFNAIAFANFASQRWAPAREAYTSELELLVSINDDHDGALASPLLGLAEVANAAGDHQAAIQHVQRVLGLHALEPSDFADAHLSWAEALVGMGKGEDARAHAVLARDSFGQIGGQYEGQQQEMQMLLAKLDAAK